MSWRWHEKCGANSLSSFFEEEEDDDDDDDGKRTCPAGNAAREVSENTKTTTVKKVVDFGRKKDVVVFITVTQSGHLYGERRGEQRETTTIGKRKRREKEGERK